MILKPPIVMNYVVDQEKEKDDLALCIDGASLNIPGLFGPPVIDLARKPTAPVIGYSVPE
jgi:hypothetical protein